MEQAFREQLEPWLKGPRPEPIRPFHWPLEFPEVMDDGGFSAVVSNPPFMGGQTLTGRLGEDVREYLVNHIGRGKRGSADLCSYFLLRDLSVASQGPGRHHRHEHDRPGRHPRGRPRPGRRHRVGRLSGREVPRWPGTAALEVALVSTGHPRGWGGAHPRWESSDGYDALTRRPIEVHGNSTG